MHSRRVYRYYCDFCKKSGCNARHIRKHETGCCSNPERICRMCEWTSGETGPQQPLGERLGIFDPDNLGPLRKATNNCPACMLSTIIAWQRSQREAGVLDGEGALWVEFDFKKETQAMWEEANRRAAEASEQAEAEREKEVCLYGYPF